MREETEEEFLHRYAAAADELTEMVDEGDIEDEAQDIELGKAPSIISVGFTRETKTAHAVFVWKFSWKVSHIVLFFFLNLLRTRLR